MSTITAYLQQNIGGGVVNTLANQWVRLRNNSTAIDYVSTAASDANGLFTVNNVPSGSYTVYIGPTSSNTPTPFGDNNFLVAPTDSANLTTLPDALTVAGAATFTAGPVTLAPDTRDSTQAVTETVLVSGVNAALGKVVAVTLTANRVVGLPLNPAVGQEIQFIITQGGAGSYTLTWPAGIKTAWQPAPVVGAISSLTIRYYGTNWQQVAGQVAVSDAGVLVHQGPGVLQSLTVTSGPYSSLLADGVTPTPPGWVVGTYEVSAKDPWHAKAWGIKADGQYVADGAMNGTTGVLTSASALFVAGDVGKLCDVPGAGALITPPTVALTGADGGVGGSTLPTGNYTFVYTWTTVAGETTIGSSSLVNYNQGTANHIITLTFPALPAGSGSWKLYCTAAPGAGFTGFLRSGNTPTYAYTVGLTANNATAAPGANSAATRLLTTIASYQSATQVTLAAVSATAVASAKVFWATDDTAAWRALYAIIPPGAQVRIPWGYSAYQGAFMNAAGIQKDVTLWGLDVQEWWGTSAADGGGSYPALAPYLKGSVLVQCQAGANGMDITGVNLIINRYQFGIMFSPGIQFNNTGHGIYRVSSTISGGHETVEDGSREDRLTVFGHDGNHYGSYAINSIYLSSYAFHSWGGGGLYEECDSTITSTGNGNYLGTLLAMWCGGLANCVTIKSASVGFPGSYNLTGWFHPQCFIDGVPAPYSTLGIATPTADQYLWRVLGPLWQNCCVEDVDLEGGGFNNPTDFGGAGANVYVRVANKIGTGAFVYPQRVYPETSYFTATANFGTAASYPSILGDILVSRGGGSPGAGTIWMGSSAAAHYMTFQGNYFQFSDPILNLRRFAQSPSEAVLVSGLDATQGGLVRVTLTAARVVGAPLNPASGQRLHFILIQGGAGAWAVTWNAIFKVTWADTGNTTGKQSTIAFEYDGTNWSQDGAQTPYV